MVKAFVQEAQRIWWRRRWVTLLRLRRCVVRKCLHAHDSKVCGKAWHHEDRFDPGDMSKCYVRLSVVDGDLHLEVNMLDGLPDVNDPDLLSTPAVEGDLSKCDADKQDSADWATYVFTPST